MAHPLGELPYRQWIVVLLVPRPDGRTDKLPVDHRTGSVIDAHNPAFWTDYATAAGIAAAWGPPFTIGLVLTAADDLFCVDIDGALQADGSWSDLSRELCAALPGTCVEISQSGRGLHIWGRHRSPPPHAKKRTDLGAEAYTELRFIALGTQPVGVLAEHCAALPAFLARYFPPRAAAAGVDMPDDGPRADWVGPESDVELLRRAMQSRSAAGVFGGKATFADLWRADAPVLSRAYPSSTGDVFDRSSADAALCAHLCFWTGCDSGRINRLLRQSGLMREKYDRDDYLPRTIDAARAQQRDVLKDKRSDAAAPALAAGPERKYELLSCDPYNAARALIQRRYTHPDGPCLKAWQDTFYRWGASRWAEMTTPDVRAMLYAFLDTEGETMYRPTQSKVSNLLDALKAAAHLDSTHSAPCWISGDETAPPGELVATANGLLHLSTRRMLPATPRFFNMNAVPFNYEPQAAAPVQWHQFLGQVWPNDTEAIATLQEMFGYLLTPDTSQQKIFLIVGPKRSGKGTIARVLTDMLGAANVTGPTLSSMAAQFGLQGLVGKLVAIVSDARLGGRTDPKQVAENLLRISGEDRVEVERKHLSSVTMRLGVRFVLLTNELPRIADASGAMASRFVILKMTESFFGREDPGLTNRLLDELPGIFQWSVDGWHRLKARGHFVEPRSSAGAAQELADLGSPIAAFVRDVCVLGPQHQVPRDELYLLWRTWCAQQGMNQCGTKDTFGADLRAALPEIADSRPRVGGERVRRYVGIGLAAGPAVHPGPTFKALQITSQNPFQ